MEKQHNDLLFADFQPVTKEKWMEKVRSDLKGKDPDKILRWHFDPAVSPEAFYTDEEIKNSYSTTHTRKNNDWEIREDIDFKEIDKAGDLFGKGVEALTVRGFNLDDDQAASRLFEAANPAARPLHFTGVYSYSKLMTRLKKEITRSELDSLQWQGSFDFDYYAYYLSRREFYHSFEANRKELKVLINKAKKFLPGYRIINVSAKTYHNAGATMVQELAFALAHGAEYLTDSTDEGLPPEDVLPRMQFTFATGSSYFPEIAKIRAAKWLWKRIAEKYGVKEEPLKYIYIHSVSSLWNKAVYDPYVNLLRTTTETMAAVIGGCDAVTVTPFDAVYEPPTATAKRHSRNQQIILKEEVNLYRVTDPASGSYYIEKLTEELINATWDLFLKIQDMGGFRAALENGFIFDEIEKSARSKDLMIARGEIKILGVNQFPNLEETMAGKITVTGKREKKGLQTYRGAEAFEKLRLRTERAVQKGHKKPAVFLLTKGNLAMRKARAAFALNFFGVAGFEVIDNNGFDTLAEGMNAARRADADLIVFCSADDEYHAMALEAASRFPDELSKIVVAGYPAGKVEDIKATGITRFIYAGCNLLDELTAYQKFLGI